MHPPRSRRALLCGATALGAGLFASLLGAPPTSAATTTALPTFTPGHVLFDVGVHSDVTRAEAAKAAAAGSSFTQYKTAVTVGTTKYTYVMAGKNPATRVANPASTIKVLLVPLVMKVSSAEFWDPTKIDSCDSHASALTRTQNSPVVKSQSWSWGGTAVGTGQATDAFQRAEFWKYVKPGAINPGYGTNLSVTTHSAVTVTVPLNQAAATQIGCGNGLEGAANIYWLDPYIKTTLIPSLKIGPSTVPIFLLHNFVEFVGSTTQCCVLGYHNAYSVTGGIQTYGLADYENSGLFSGVSDISTLTHEVGEWQNDPYTINPTPAWGNVGQVSGCQGNLEVGDPLSGTNFTDTVGGFTYHLQELAFFSWFYHQKPSLGVNGWYSDQGTFKIPAANCPPGGAAALASTPGQLNAVSAAATHAWAVGLSVSSANGNQSLVLSDNGTGWTRVTSLDPTRNTQLDGVATVSATDAWAAGYNDTGKGTTEPNFDSLMLRWNGTSWKQVPTPSPGGTSGATLLSGIASVSANDAWAVGEYNTGGGNLPLVLRWNGTSWKQVPAPHPIGAVSTQLTGVAALSPTDAWAVGEDTNNAGNTRSFLLRWNGTSWKQVPTPNTGGTGITALTGVAALSANNAWATGYYNIGAGTDQPLLLHWNGTAWTQATVPSLGSAGNNRLYGVSASSPTATWAVGSQGSNSLILHGNGTSWTRITSPSPGITQLNGVSAVSATNAWAVGYFVGATGSHPLILHWNGTSWKQVTSPS